MTPGSIWDGATAFHNVAPNSYVIRTKWTTSLDIDGVAELIGEGNVGRALDRQQRWTYGDARTVS